MKEKVIIILSITIPIIIGIVIGVYAMKNDDYDLLQLLESDEDNAKTLIVNNIDLQVNVNQINKKEKKSTSNSNTVVDSRTDTNNNNNATTGSGLNLLLINNITTECFVKEYLEICAENQNGQLDKINAQNPVYSTKASVLTAIGINLAESRFYAAGDGMTLPKTDLPAGNDGTPIWDGNTFSLKAWDVTARNSNGSYGTAIGGPLQYISGNSITKINGVSKYNKGTATAGNIGVNGDCYLFSDAVVGLNAYLSSGLSELKMSSDITDSQAAVVTSISHNRGAGGLDMLYGIGYRQIFNYKAANSYLDKSKITDSTSRFLLNVIYHDSTSTVLDNNVDAKLTAYSTARSFDYYFANSFPFIANGWYYTEEGGTNAIAAGLKYGTRIYECWNQFFPDEQVSNQEEYSRAISNHSKKLVTALCDYYKDSNYITAQRCAEIYGTESNGDYKEYGNYTFGEIYKITGEKTDCYVAADSADLVINLDAMTADHVVSVVGLAATIYAKMLHYAGVGIDPTNPSDYLQEYRNNSEWTPGEDVTDKLRALSIDISNLSQQRKNILSSAVKYINDMSIAYHQCRHSTCNGSYTVGGKTTYWHAPLPCSGNCYDSLKPDHLDCSSYVYRVFSDAGFSMTGFPTNTSSYQGSSAVRRIDLSQLQPGDILWKNGHVSIYVSKSAVSGKVNVMDFYSENAHGEYRSVVLSQYICAYKPVELND